MAALFAAPPIKGRPDDFIGAVGKFTLRAEISSTHFRLDETATLTVKLHGKGDVSQLRTPDLSQSKTFAERFDVVGPPNKKVEDGGVQFAYPVRARSVAVKAVPSIRLSIYDDSPPRPQYRLLRTAEIPVQVLPVPARDAAPPPSSETLSAGPKFESWTPIAAAVAAVVVVLLFIIRPRTREMPNDGGSALATNRRRGKPIDKPAAFVRSESEKWIDELSEALSLPSSKRTSAEIVAAAKQFGLDEQDLQSLGRNLAALDASRFGGQTPTVNEAELQRLREGIQRLKAPRSGF